MTRRFPWLQVSFWTVLGGLVLVTGCSPSSEGNDTAVASMIVEGIDTRQDECHIPTNAEDAAVRILELVNKERADRGLNPVAVNPLLSQMAEEYACKLIEERFFSHTSPQNEGPGQRAMLVGYVFLAIGENLAGGQSSPEQAVREWMASQQGHRENILAAQWKETGIAVRTGGEYGVYWVQVFGNPP